MTLCVTRTCLNSLSYFITVELLYLFCDLYFLFNFIIEFALKDFLSKNTVECADSLPVHTKSYYCRNQIANLYLGHPQHQKTHLGNIIFVFLEFNLLFLDIDP